MKLPSTFVSLVTARLGRAPRSLKASLTAWLPQHRHRGT